MKNAYFSIKENLESVGRFWCLDLYFNKEGPSLRIAYASLEVFYLFIVMHFPPLLFNSINLQ